MSSDDDTFLENDDHYEDSENDKNKMKMKSNNNNGNNNKKLFSSNSSISDSEEEENDHFNDNHTHRNGDEKDNDDSENDNDNVYDNNDDDEKEEDDDEGLDVEEEEDEGEDEEDEEDEEEDDEEDDEDDEDPFSSSSHKKRKKNVSSNKNKKKKKAKSIVNRFIEEEADVDEDEEDEEDDEDYDLMYNNEKAEAEQVAATSTSSLNSIPANRSLYDDEDDAEAIVNQLKRRHQQQTRAAYDDDSYSNLDIAQSDVAQQSLLPSVSDPRLFVFRCKVNREQHLVLAIMNKYIDYLRRGTPLMIKSVIASNSKGFIYIEAEREPYAKEAVSGLREISAWSIKLVPLHEMTAVLNIQAKTKKIKKNSFARVKRAGLFRGDICKIVEVLDGGTRAVVQLVPRLDLGGTSSRPSKGQRPPKKLFHPQNLRNSFANSGEIIRKRFPGTSDYFDFYNNEYYNNGFLFKEFNVKTMLSTENVNPTLEEINEFTETKANAMGLEGISTNTHIPSSDSSNKLKTELAKGDTVRVVSGDLKGLMGIVVSTTISNNDNIVKIMPLHEEIKDTLLDFPLSQLIKYVKIGDHVKVTNGRYSGETGNVVSISDPNDDSNSEPVAIILADSLAKEIQVKINDLQESAEICTGFDRLNGKELYDLVLLNNPIGEVGIVIYVGKDFFRIRNMKDKEIKVTDKEIQKKIILRKNASALDSQQNVIMIGEIVQVLNDRSKYSGQTGTIKHIFKTFCFLHNNKSGTMSGIFVVPARHVIIAGNKMRSQHIQNTSVDNYSIKNNVIQQSHRINYSQRSNEQQPRMKSFDEDSITNKNNDEKNDDKKDERNDKRDPALLVKLKHVPSAAGVSSLMGKTVKIRKGKFKTYIGMVVEEHDEKIKIEMHSKSMVLTMLKKDVTLIGTRDGILQSTIPQKNEKDEKQKDVKDDSNKDINRSTNTAQNSANNNVNRFPGTPGPRLGSATPLPSFDNSQGLSGGRTPLNRYYNSTPRSNDNIMHKEQNRRHQAPRTPSAMDNQPIRPNPQTTASSTMSIHDNNKVQDRSKISDSVHGGSKLSSTSLYQSDRRDNVGNYSSTLTDGRLHPTTPGPLTPRTVLNNTNTGSFNKHLPNTPALYNDNNSNQSTNLKPNVISMTPLNPITPGYVQPKTPGMLPNLNSKLNSVSTTRNNIGIANILNSMQTPGFSAMTPGVFESNKANKDSTGTNIATPNIANSTSWNNNQPLTNTYNINNDYMNPFTPMNIGGLTTPAPGTPGTSLHTTEENESNDNTNTTKTTKHTIVGHINEWLRPGMYVRIIQGKDSGLVGIVQSILENGNQCCIEINNKKNNVKMDTIIINIDCLSHVQPEKNDRVVIMCEENNGAFGTMIGTDGSDGIIKLDIRSEIKIFPLTTIAKIST